MKLTKKIISFLIPVLLYFLLFLSIRGCYLKEQREKFVKDSLESDPLFQDSIRVARERYERLWQEKKMWRDAHTLVIIDISRVLYHTSTKCDSVFKYVRERETTGTEDIEAYRLTTASEAIDMGYKPCRSCEEIEDVYDRFTSEELVEPDYDY